VVVKHKDPRVTKYDCNDDDKEHGGGKDDKGGKGDDKGRGKD
jgi:hypothetical protein